MQKRLLSKEREKIVFEPMCGGYEKTLYEDAQPVLLPQTDKFERMHFHDCFEVGICLDGEGLLLSDGKVRSVRKGDIMFVAPNVSHYSRSIHTEPCICKFVYLNENQLFKYLQVEGEKQREESLLIAKQIPVVIRKNENERAYNILNEIFTLKESAVTKREKSIFLRVALMLSEADLLFKGIAVKREVQPKVADDKIAKIAERLYLRHYEDVPSSVLAKECFLSESQFRKKFTKAYGVSPIQYRNRIRTMVATELLRQTDLTVMQICDKVGYKTASDFYRAFKKEKGVSPQEYRKDKSR